MSTVVRLFLGEAAESQVRAALEKLGVPTIGKRQSSNGSHVVNIFDPGSLDELIGTESSGTKEGILIADKDAISQDLNALYNNFIGKGIQLLGITDPIEDNLQRDFRFLLGLQNEIEP